MPDPLQFDFVLVYFVYGLAFFSMGLVVMMEARRSPLQADARILWPLAIFGLVHGCHEWVEAALIVRAWFGFSNPEIASFLRLALLVFSFASLSLYGLRVLNPQGRLLLQSNTAIVASLLCLYLLVLASTSLFQPGSGIDWSQRADVLARYLLAMPGAGMAALALIRQAGQAQPHRDLAWNLRLAGLGFAAYSVSQVLVTPLDMFPASVLNSAAFLSWTGFPIQGLRAAMAVLITLGLMRATQVIEDQRKRELAAAQTARLHALEQVQRDLVERETMRRKLLRHTVVAQEEERARVARELHDETSQFLTALSLDLATLNNHVRRNPEAGRLIERLQTLNRQMSTGIYRLMRDLRPALLDDLGLVAALGYLADEARSFGLHISLTVAGNRQRLEPLVETVLFRIAQEALTNVARHAGCDKASVYLAFEPSWAELCILDEGVGFDPGQSHTPPHGWGLEGMRERAESVGGRLEIQSAPGAGTRVSVSVPVVRREPPERKENDNEPDSIAAGR